MATTEENKDYAERIVTNVITLLYARLGFVRGTLVLNEVRGIINRLAEPNMTDTLGEDGWQDYIRNGAN